MSEFRGMNARKTYVRMLPFSDEVSGDYVAAQRRLVTAMPDGQRCAATYILSPLFAGVFVKLGSETLAAIEFLTGHDVKPRGPIHPGYVAELLFAEGMTRSFSKLITENIIAREHINALESMLDSSPLVFDAQQLIRITETKNAALAVLRELGL